MSEFDDLDAILAPLRGVAMPTELAGEREMVELMATTHRHRKGNHMFTSRRARVAALIAAGVIGFGGVAAAGPGGPLDRSVSPSVTGSDGVVEIEEEIPEPEEDVVEEDVVEEDAVEEDAVEDDDIVEEDVESDDVEEEIADEGVVEEGPVEDAPVPDAGVAVIAGDPYPETAFDERDCVIPGNHGKTVSAVARGESPFEDVEVRDAARSMCGKTGFDDVERDETHEVEEDAIEDVDGSEVGESEDPSATHSPSTKDRSPKSEQKANSAKGPKNGKGKPSKHDD